MDAFLALVVINFVAFHAIWLLPRIRGSVLTAQFFRAEMCLPLALFTVCGIAGLLALQALTAF